MAKKRMRTTRLEGDYATVAEYAKAEGITKRAARLRIAKTDLGLRAVRIGRQIIIRI